MANAAALINEGLWRKDKEFQRLPRFAQCTFCQVLSQRDLDTAGVLTLHLDLLAKGCEELTPEQLRADFAVLEERRFLFVDYDTDELFIRSYIRTISVKNQNSWRSVPKNSRMVASEKIRRELAAELRRLPRKDARDLADEIDPRPTPSGPGSDHVETPFGPGTPSEPRLDGDSSVLVPVLESLSVVGHLGEEPPRCSKHINDPDEPSCWACKRKREKWEADAAAATIAAQANAAERRRQELKCTICEGTNWIPNTDPAVRCGHQESAHA